MLCLPIGCYSHLSCAFSLNLSTTIITYMYMYMYIASGRDRSMEGWL